MNKDGKIEPRNRDYPILMVTPTGKDADVACEVLEKFGFHCKKCEDLTELCANAQESAGALFIAEEALSSEGVLMLAQWLQDQPPWSDIPVIVLTTGGSMKRLNLFYEGAFGDRANVTLLERPFHIATLISVLEGALRARLRQFEIRDLLDQREELLQMEKKARAEAEKVNRAKDEFLATLSHELRTPLTTMLGWAKVLMTHKLDDESSMRAIEAIEKSAKSQSQLIDDLLDVSRIITDKFQVEKKSLDLVQLLHTSMDMVRPAAESKGILLHLDISENPGPISGDPHRLQQVMWNILSNAIKFTPAEGSIFVKMKRSNSHATITVRDTGKGIRSDFLPHIFERFRQADSSYSRNQGGLGLGLAIVQHIVNLHGGTVHAESEGEGKGAKVTVILPVVLENKAFQNGKSVRKTNQGKPDLNGIHVLVVEDDPESQELLKLILEHGKGTVRCASSVADAWIILQEWKPHIVISDIGMPTADGYQLISALRSDPETKDIPAVAVTAYASESDKKKALDAGFQFHMAKPVDPSDLLKVVADLSHRISSL